jgi:hypothetical protein
LTSVSTAVLAAVLTARHRHRVAQNYLSCQQSLDLNHEDRRDVWFVQIFLGENVSKRFNLQKGEKPGSQP